MRKLRILLAEVFGVGLFLGWLMWKYPELVDHIIPWVALLIVWHVTWEFVLDTKLCRSGAISLGRRVNRVLILLLVFLIGGGISLLYWVVINKSLVRLASLEAASKKSEPKPLQLSADSSTKPTQTLQSASTQSLEAPTHTKAPHKLPVIQSMQESRMGDASDPYKAWTNEQVANEAMAFAQKILVNSDAVERQVMAQLENKTDPRDDDTKMQMYQRPEELEFQRCCKRDALVLREELLRRLGPGFGGDYAGVLAMPGQLDHGAIKIAAEGLISLANELKRRSISPKQQ